MTALKIAAVIVLVLFLLSLVRLGGNVTYGEAGVTVRIRFGAFQIQVLPRKTKGEKKEKEPQKKTEKKPEKKKGGSISLLKRVLPLVGEAAGELKRRIRIDRLYLDFISGGEDAAGAAMAYGYANMAVGMIWPILENNFDVRDRCIRTAVDFSAPGHTIYIDAAFSARLGQLVSFALRFGWKFLRAYLEEKRNKNMRKEAV